MSAGQVLQFETEVMFAEDDLLPSDFSVVVWAEKQEVKLTSEGSDVSAPFPIFKLDESIQQYNWNGEAIDGSQKDDGIKDDESKDDDANQEDDGSKDDDVNQDEKQEEESTTDDTIPHATAEEPYSPATSYDKKFLHHFTYSDGAVKCTTEVTSNDTFQTDCNIK